MMSLSTKDLVMFSPNYIREYNYILNNYTKNGVI
jgi:hypothetical protein